MIVRVVGVGDAFTSKYWNACLLVETGATRLLVDAPPAVARALGALPEPVALGEIDHVLITHLHGDHCAGLEQLLFWRRFVVGKRAAVHAIPEVLAGLWDTRLRGGMEALMDETGKKSTLALDDYADVRPLEAGTTSIGDLSIDWRPTIHHIPTSAIRIASGDARVGYSADTAFDPTLVRWLAACDLFFHETNHGIHTPLEKLLGLPDEDRARMKLIHYPDALDPERAGIPCAREGDRIELG